MRRANVNITVIALLSLCIPLKSEAVNLKPTPLQTKLAESISSSSQGILLAQVENQPLEFGQQSSDERTGKKSMLRAGLYSALLPGLGEYYVGNRRKARVFFAIEAVAWIGFITFETYGNWKEDDFIRFADEHANANLAEKDENFLDWVGFYDDIDEYNSLGRVQDLDRPYLVDNSENHWRWQSEGDRSTYRHLKNRSREAFRRADFMLGLAVVNRIASIIDALRDARGANRLIKDSGFSLAGNVRYRLEVNPLNQDKPIRLAVFTRF